MQRQKSFEIQTSKIKIIGIFCFAICIYAQAPKGFRNLSGLITSNEKLQLLGSGKIYHIYNRVITKADVFFETKNYEYFMNLYAKHIDPIADTYAWLLMKNHFHLLV